MTTVLSGLELLAYLGLGRRDPTAIFHLLMLCVAIQGIVWLIGRDSLDNEWWRSFALAALCTIVPVITLTVGAADGISGIAAAAILSALAVWIVGGLLYEPETRQRVILSLAAPAASVLIFPVSLKLSELIASGFGAN